MNITTNQFFYIYIFKYLIYAFGISVFLMSLYAELELTFFYLIAGSLITILTKQTIKYSNYIYTSIMAIYVYIGYLLMFPIIAINKEEFIYGRYSSIGLFDFQLDQMITVYFYITLFLCVNFFVGIVFKKKKYVLDLNSAQQPTSSKKNYLFLVFAIVFIQFFLNIFMFTHKVGIPGLIAEQLPLRMSGLLYYYRFLVYPFLVIYLIHKGELKSNFLKFVLFLEMIEASFLSTSKAIVLLHSFPIFFILFKEGKIKPIIWLFLLCIALFPFVALGRNIIYSYDALSVGVFFESLSYIFTHDYEYNILGHAVTLFVSRIVGLKEFLMSTYSPCGYSNSMFYFTYHLGITSSAPPINQDCMYGFLISEVNKDGFAFGYVLDLLSHIKLSSSGIVSFIVISSIHTVLYISIEYIVVKGLKIFIKNTSLVYLLSIFVIFLTISSLFMVKILLIVLFVLYILKLLSKRSHIESIAS